MVMLIMTASTLGITMIIGAYTISTYNTIQTARNDYQEKESEVLLQHQRRITLIGNTVRTVKANSKFEKETLTQVTKLRTENNGTTTQKLRKLEKGMLNLKVQVEAYPELQANKTYQKLMEVLEQTENSIYQSRDELNEIARDYNTYIELFPRNQIAKLFNAKKLPYFRTQEEAKEANYEADI